MNKEERPHVCANYDNCSIDGRWCFALSMYVADVQNIEGCKNWQPI